MIVWEWIKNKKLKDISLKKRREGNILIIYGETLEISYLNKIAAQIMELSNGSNTMSDIVDVLLKKYDVEENELKIDIITLVRELQWKRIIKLEE